MRRMVKGAPALACLGAVAACQGPEAHHERPNVVIVMTDDQGYDDFSAHGNPVVRTPELDAFRQAAVRLSDFHSAPMSTATRGQLLTGLDAVRNGALNVSSGRTTLRAGLPTMAEFFSEAGYSTAIFGKWHLGDNYPFRPEDRGFGEALWYPSSHIGSVPDYWGNDCFDDVYIHNGEQERQEGYCTDVFFSKARKWMAEQAGQGRPFFLYLAPNAPHGPFRAPQEAVESVRLRLGKADELGVHSRRMGDLAVYLAMIECVDAQFGRTMDFLKSSGLEDNTIVLFMTDNGSVLDSYVPSPSRRGKKGQLSEGGHRVPFFLRYPAGIGGGCDVDGLACMQDVLPTLLDFCGIPFRKGQFDGMSLRRALEGRGRLPDDRTLCLNFSRMPTMFAYPSPYGQAAVRRSETAVMRGSWRLLGEDELYDISSDPLERNNVIGANPGIVRSLKAARDAWWKDVEKNANALQPALLGPGPELKLTACDWVDVFTDQQAQVLKGTRRNSYWMLDVAEQGRYRFELRRWPRELGLPLKEAPEGGKACDVCTAKVFISCGDRTFRASTPVGLPESFVAFEFDLPAGQAVLHTAFDDGQKEALFGAYYVYARKVL